MILKKDKTQFTLEHAQILFQTLADIFGEKYNMEITANVKERGENNGSKIH